MDDRCEIRLDAEGSGDDTFDPDLLIEIPPSPDSLVVYQGPCSIRAAPSYQVGLSGAQYVAERSYLVRLPLAAPPVSIGSVVRCTASRRDPQLVGQRFTVTDVRTGTFTVSRTLSVERLPVTAASE